MADAILDALGTVLTRWTMGGSAAAHAPAAWRGLLGEDAAEAELRLLALSGQLLGALTIPEPVGTVAPRGDLPPLAYPPLPDALRPRARRVLQHLRDPLHRRFLLDFLVARGWTLHPGDWMPRPDEAVPDIYAAWQDWAAISGSHATAPEALDAENWDDFGPAARHAALTALRRQDPMRTSTLLDEKIAGESADHRLRLLDLLATGLSEADRPLLERLTSDRAPRVKALAATLLARLGHGGHAGEDGAELAAFFTVRSKGLLRRSRTVVAEPLKTPAQRMRRTTLFQHLSFDAFAGALSLSPSELVAAWPWGSDPLVDQPLAAMMARSASREAIDAVVAVLTTDNPVDPAVLVELLPRLTPSQRHQAAARLLRHPDTRFATVLTIGGGDAGIDDAIRSPAGAALLSAVEADDTTTQDQAFELLALGLIASCGAARQALDRLAATGLTASDPRLDMLRLNAALDNRRNTE